MSAPPVPVAIIGMGRMGRAIATLAPERGCDVVVTLGSVDMRSRLTRDSFANAAVAIEFTEPSAAVKNAVACVEVGMPVVIGTTGWSAQMPVLTAAVETNNGLVLWSPNFSLGMQLFIRIAENAARLMSAGSYDQHIVETHHAAKKDAPSGTAIAIAEAVTRGTGHAAVPTTSVRVGHVPGTHEVIFDAPFEQIRLSHEARDRRVFADGALYAARWLSTQRRHGIYTMRDVIDSPLGTEQA